MLTDKKDAPATAIAEVQFQADAQGKDNTTTQIVEHRIVLPPPGRRCLEDLRLSRDSRRSAGRGTESDGVAVMRPRRLVAALASLAAGAAGLGVATFQATPAASVPLLQIGKAHAEFGPTLQGDKPIFILVLGSDSRPGTPLDKGLCDSIHILGIEPEGEAGDVGRDPP